MIRFEITLAPGEVWKVKLIKDNIAMELGVTDVQVSDPMPGRPAVNVDLPDRDSVK